MVSTMWSIHLNVWWSICAGETHLVVNIISTLMAGKSQSLGKHLGTGCRQKRGPRRAFSITLMFSDPQMRMKTMSVWGTSGKKETKGWNCFIDQDSQIRGNAVYVDKLGELRYKEKSPLELECILLSHLLANPVVPMTISIGKKKDISHLIYLDEWKYHHLLLNFSCLGTLE